MRTRIAVTVLFALGTLLVPLAAEAAPPFACSRLLGPSTTRQIWDGGFETYAGGPYWEGQMRGAARITSWGPGGNGWTAGVLSSCGTPDRAVLHVIPSSGFTVDTLIADIRVAVDGIHVTLPSVIRIELIPVNGGPDNSLCYLPGKRRPVQASSAHPLVEQAIAAAVGGDVFAGPDVEHPCEMYGDNQGHLTPEGQVYVAQTLGTHYSVN